MNKKEEVLADDEVDMENKKVTNASIPMRNYSNDELLEENEMEP
ncbi:hypothetical protein QA584_20250 [Anaerocolumna sp. AGMB13025]|nr:hypothetical protein [Anaerocolumna sp. AGMB13025]WFR55931.1 hypothetical protein QA584_20250 [Anaerocolumna sp. AGMB13025]